MPRVIDVGSGTGAGLQAVSNTLETARRIENDQEKHRIEVNRALDILAQEQADREYALGSMPQRTDQGPEDLFNRRIALAEQLGSKMSAKGARRMLDDMRAVEQARALQEAKDGMREAFGGAVKRGALSPTREAAGTDDATLETLRLMDERVETAQTPEELAEVEEEFQGILRAQAQEREQEDIRSRNLEWAGTQASAPGVTVEGQERAAGILSEFETFGDMEPREFRRKYLMALHGLIDEEELDEKPGVQAPFQPAEPAPAPPQQRSSVPRGTASGPETQARQYLHAVRMLGDITPEALQQVAEEMGFDPDKLPPAMRQALLEAISGLAQGQ